ncbi:MAG: translation initiation factor IF-2 [Chloroflexi bacterium]|jgi:translation initiation factor IF-2|nr:translation initiation factor IF-2 [Chloroflexota bacterium]
MPISNKSKSQSPGKGKGTTRLESKARPTGNSSGAQNSRGNKPGGGRNAGAQRPHSDASSAQRGDRRATAKTAEAEPRPKTLELPQQITLRELAERMGCSPIELIKQLMNAGVMANINQQIDYDTAAIVAEDMGYTVKEYQPPAPVLEEEPVAPTEPAHRRTYTAEEQKYLTERPPVVTILGHVDHGKTSLLDVIRSSSVQSHEAGGITQHIGAYQIQVNGKAITFLDTPGHEAFTAMRARGAKVTDLVILVVAADDGVQPQTREAIDHARAARVPIIVAVNKMDLPTANPDLVQHQLADLGLVPEDWGGDSIQVFVSAKTKEGIDNLLDMILLVAEMAELKANPRREAEGAVVEGKLDRARGPIATLLLQEGTLKTGDTIVVGQTYGRIKAMFDYQGNPIKRATPSMPVVVMGLKDVPDAGDTFKQVDSERIAREIVEERQQQAAAAAQPTVKLSLEDIFEQAQAGKVKELNLILKADVQGSIEPIRNSLEKINVGDLRIRFVHEGVGNVGESDVMLAIASEAIVIGFSVNVDPAAQRLAEAEGISIRTYNIIYRLIEDVQLALAGMLEPEQVEVVQGQAIVREVFSIPRVGNIAGSQVMEGKAHRNNRVRVKRDDKVVFEGRVGSLKRFAKDVREVTTGMECGIGIDGFNDIQVGDILEFYTLESVKRTEK